MPYVDFIAGWVSGALGLAVGHPLDTIKVRLQTQSKYKGISDCVIRTYKHEGIHGFFKGMAFPVLTVAVSNAVLFGSYSSALDYLNESQLSNHHQGNQPSSAAVFMAGCFSGLAQVFVTAPIDLVKVRLQSQTKSKFGKGGGNYRGPMHCIAVIFKEQGFRGLFRGMWPLALRDVPCYGLYFLPYELTCRMLTEKNKQPGTLAVVVAGGTAGVVTWAVATPMDVVKSRVQMSGAGGRVYRGTMHCVTASLREEGIRVFFKGLLLNSIRAFPVNAVTFLSYESLVRAMTPTSAKSQN